MTLWHALLSMIAFAAEPACEPVDLRPLIGPPMHQGDSGYCFAHSASFLIQARLGVRVSPMQLAAVYILSNPSELSGSAAPSVRALLTPSFFEAWHNDLLTEPASFTAGKILTESGLMDTGGEEYATLLAANFTGLCPEARLPTGENVYKKYLSRIRAFHAARVKNGLSAEDRDPIGAVSDPAAREMAWSWRRWVEEQCGTLSKPRAPLVPVEISMAKNLAAFRALQASPMAGAMLKARNKVLEGINRQLSRGNPVSIGYALGDLFPENAQAGAPSRDKVDHASVIAGRRKIGRQCYYFVRNTFGEDMADYAKKFRGRLEDGGVWVLPEELPSLYSAVWLE